MESTRGLSFHLSEAFGVVTSRATGAQMEL